jgi:8-oxo-dGTP pyrophosphatase MutT (NUDIX family)
MSFTGVLENVVANLIAATLVGGIAYLLLYLRMSGVFQRIRRLIQPDERVFFLENHSIEKLQKTEIAPFQSPISKLERDHLVEFYGKRNGSNPHNGSCVRLDHVSKTDTGLEMQISLVDFYDFIATNLTVYPANAPIRSFRNQIATVIRSFHLFPVMNQVIEQAKKYTPPPPRGIGDILQNKALANIVAVSVLVVDKEGKIGIVKRTKNVAISSGNFGMACAGTVSEVDFAAEDPFLSCVVREMEEECNIKIDHAHFDGIVVPTQKMQPVFLYHVNLENTWEEHYSEMIKAKDYAFETESLYAVPLKHSIRFAAQARMTDTAAFQIKKYAENNGYTSHWYLEMIKPMSKNKFLCKKPSTNVQSR